VMADNGATTPGQAEDEVTKDIGYFDELRRAVGWASPIALFGTSGLAMYQRIDSMQADELRKRIESVQSDKLRAQLFSGAYDNYRFRVRLVRYTAMGSFLLLLLPLSFISSIFSGPAAHPYSYYLAVGLILAAELLLFVLAKAVQVATWRIASDTVIQRQAIRVWRMIPADSIRTETDTGKDDSTGLESV
jgi:hypothetical protein